MAENYKDIIKARIGRVKASVVADNYFPVSGDTIRLDAKTKWGQTSEWQTQSGTGDAVTEAGNLTKQEDSKSVAISGSGELGQKFVARNYLFETAVTKRIYAMLPQVLPYFNVTATEIVRVGDAALVYVTPEHGYATPLGDTTVVRIYRENETVSPVKTLDAPVGKPLTDGTVSFPFEFTGASERGIYDVEVDVTDTATGVTFSKRVNKLITVTPKLCPKPADTTTGYEVVCEYKSQTSYQSGTTAFQLRLWRNVDDSGLHYAEAVIPRGEAGNAKYDDIPIGGLPAGTTLCLKLDGKETDAYPFRLFLTGNSPSTVSSDNGTPNFTYDSPLVVTHDEEGVWQWGWRAYGALQLRGNCRNIVFDARGYRGEGIRYFPFDSSIFVDSCFFLTNGASDIEVFGCDIDGAGFAGISAKTDPSPNEPWYWRENGWEFENLKIHHCKFRNTIGEGIYLGYYATGEKSGTNADGEEVKYHAHIMRDIRVYRCDFIDNGFDSVQINNACGVEFCYNRLSGCGYRREPNQGSAFSCTMDGKIYNCVVRDNYNVIAVMSPFLGRLEVYNCILVSARLEAGFIMTSWTSNTDDGTSQDDTHEFDIHNNVVKAARIANITGDITYSKYTMDDNIFITESGDTELPGYLHGDGNVFVKGDLDYEDIDRYLKVADSANYDYRLAHDSLAVSSGKVGKCNYDMRGYKNWYNKVYRSGPYMGIYKNANIVDAAVALDSMVLSDGTPTTLDRTVPVRLSYRGDIVKYRIGETADLAGMAWIDLPAEGGITYTLSEGFGAKTVYAQVASSTEESGIVSASITLISTPISLDSITLSGGSLLKVGVTFDYSGSFTPSKYRLGETADLADVAWLDYADGITYTFATAGEKTLYGQLQDASGNISEIKGADITVTASGRKACLSVGWNRDYVPNSTPGLSVYDADTGFTKVNTELGASNERRIYDIDGNLFCTLLFSKITGYYTTHDTLKGAVTNDDSGIYPDIYLLRNIGEGGNGVSSSSLTFNALSPGRYQVRLLANTTWSIRDIPNDQLLYKAVTNTDDKTFTLPLQGIQNNTDSLTEPVVVTVGDDGMLRIDFGVNSAGSYYFAVLNVVEIEEVAI